MVVLTEIILDEVATYIANNLISHLTVGTGDDDIALTTTDLETPVQIGVSDRNKAAVSGSPSITSNSFVQTFKITAPEPDSQPVNLSEVGIQPGATTTDELKAGFTFNPSTKDNESQWTVRFTGTVIEGA
jgi:hypothetical protein